MAQDEQAAVIRAERRRFWATSIISGLSIIVGGLLFAGVLFVIYLLAMGGHDWVAGTLAATGVFAVIGALWQTQKPKN